MSILGAAVTTTFSWWKAGSAGQWYSEVGSLLNDSADGGVLENLKRETGRSYPYLEALRQDVVDKWRAYQRAMPWNKSSTLGTYQDAVNTFGIAVEAEDKAAVDFLSGGLAGITEIVKKPFVLIGIIALIVVVMVLLIVRK